MRYDDKWVLECTLTRMRSRRIYEPTSRKLEIMTLSGRTCLQSHLGSFNGLVGFNSNGFTMLQKKTKTMEEFSCHGGLVLDEIKFSDLLDVKSTGRLYLNN